MKAAIVTAPDTTPVFGEFKNPVAQDGCELITIKAAALTHITKGRASGSHYSAENQYPFVPGVDGVGTTQDGRRVYFFMSEAPFGAMAELTLVDPRRTILLPDGIDDVAAAALANPGMSCWAALVERARFQRGETVLINGATGSAGTVAVQVAKHLGATKIIVTGRNAGELNALSRLGADIAIPFELGLAHPAGAEDFERFLINEFAQGIDVVIDYLWGTSARTILMAIAKAVEDAHPVRFIEVGEASREAMELPGAALRSSAVQLMGSGLKSVPLPKLIEGVRNTFTLAAQSGLHLPTEAVSLSKVADTWNTPGKRRLVYTLP
jgi:NADPH:quinone reductase-like Zn-dependent oxidoreductase